MKEQMKGEPRAVLLEEFGYDQSKQVLAQRANRIMQTGKNEVLKESISIYGKTLSAYSTGANTPEQMAEFIRWTNGETTPPVDALLRLAISIDFAHQLREEYSSDATAVALFMGMKAEFFDNAMATAIHRVDPEDLGLVHDAFMEIVTNDKLDLPYSATGEYEGLEKYFQAPKETEVFSATEFRESTGVKEGELKTYRGVLEFFSETGTEGGYWAFQDEEFMGIPDDTQICEKCHYYKDYVDHKHQDAPIVATRSLPLTGLEEEEKKGMCPPGEHEWVLVFPEGKWSYDGLHILEDGDEITIYDKEDPEVTVWEGKIELEDLGLFNQDAFGWWIHSDQRGIERETWAKWFMEGNPARLISHENKENK